MKMKYRLKSLFYLVVICFTLLTVLSACNGNRQTGFDSVQTFDKAYLKLGDEWKLVEVKSWRDFENGDEIQIQTKTGEVYLTHYANMVLVKSK